MTMLDEDEPTPEQIMEAFQDVGPLPRLIPLLNANMMPREMVAAGKGTEKYLVDGDFHLLIDMLESTLDRIEEVLA